MNKMHLSRKLTLPALLLSILILSACLGNLEVKPGSYKKLPEGVSISKYGTLLAQGKVVSVADADTITVLGKDKKRYRIRLQGIDAPEKKQAYGALCKTKMTQLLKNQRVDVEAYKRDRYKRIIAKVKLRDNDVALQMIRSGCGWHYTAYADEQSWSDQRAYAKAERDARQQQLGLWRDANPEAPWDYRRRR